MSRIGRNPIALPEGVNAVVEGNKITVTGPLGTLSQDFDSVKVEIENRVITLTRPNDNNDVKAKHGLYRALIANMVKGHYGPLPALRGDGIHGEYLLSAAHVGARVP